MTVLVIIEWIMGKIHFSGLKFYLKRSIPCNCLEFVDTKTTHNHFLAHFSARALRAQDCEFWRLDSWLTRRLRRRIRTLSAAPTASARSARASIATYRCNHTLFSLSCIVAVSLSMLLICRSGLGGFLLRASCSHLSSLAEDILQFSSHAAFRGLSPAL